MTVIIGVLCKDGVVVGSDSSSTFSIGQFRTIEQPVKKVHVVGGDVLVACTGQVGLAQRFEAAVASERTTAQFNKKNALTAVRGVCKATIEDFIETKVQPGQVGALMAFWCKDGFALCEFGSETFQPELKTDDLWYVSMGSGQPITDPFLGLLRRVFWQSGKPLVKEALFAVTWALEHTIELNPGGINGPAQIGVLSKDNGGSPKARILSDDELNEHVESVKAAEKHLAGYASILGGASAQPIPQPPKED